MQSQAMKRGGGHQSGYDELYDDYQAPRGQSYDADAHQDWIDQKRYAAEVEDQQYDPRFYAPNPDEPYAWDEDGNPLFYAPAKRQGGSSRGALMLGAVFAVAVLGAGGLFAYKAFGGREISGEPPLIRAETEPVKTTPEPAAANGEARNKAVYDRVDDAKHASKVVSREEQPVDLPAAPSAAPRHDGSRVILPGGGERAATGGDEPRRVKTMTIRPDGAIAAAEPAQPPAAAAAKPLVEDPIAQLARTGQAPKSEFDDGIMAETAKPAPQPQAAQRAPAAAPKPAPQPAAPALRPTVPQQVAAATPRAAVPATPARTTPSGGFVVQVTSQRSEQDARSAYASLQRKFPQVLGSYQASIQTATVPERGTYYRVRVGPFGTSNDASTLCTSLRSAGGDCVVSRN